MLQNCIYFRLRLTTGVLVAGILCLVMCPLVFGEGAAPVVETSPVSAEMQALSQELKVKMAHYQKSQRQFEAFRARVAATNEAAKALMARPRETREEKQALRSEVEAALLETSPEYKEQRGALMAEFNEVRDFRRELVKMHQKEISKLQGSEMPRPPVMTPEMFTNGTPRALNRRMVPIKRAGRE